MSDWKWWASFDGGERYTVGPEDSREAIIQAATEERGGEPFVICEATQEPVRMSRFVDVGYMAERADDRAHEEHADPDGTDLIFDYPADAARDLEARVKRAVDEWQDAHRITPTSWAFTAARNEEQIDPEAAA